MNTDASAAKSSPRGSSPSKEEAADPIDKQAETQVATATENPTESAEPENFDATVRVAKESSVRKLITFVMSRLDRDGKVTIQALNLCVRKAIMLASIARNRLGDVYQVNSLLVVQEGSAASEAGKADDEEANDKVRSTSGI